MMSERHEVNPSAARDAGTDDLQGEPDPLPPAHLDVTGGVRITVEIGVWERAASHPGSVSIEWDVSAALARRFGAEPLGPWPGAGITSVRLLADGRPVMVMPMHDHGAGLHTICTAGGEVEDIPTQ